MNKALLISVTGTGKTYAAAFAMRELGFKRVLFVVHRKQIAKQAKASFERVFGSGIKTGILSGNARDFNADFLFATVQTLSKQENLKAFSRDYFEACIYDEAHHTSADSYKKVMDYFEPSFTLGMTATPDKRDDNIEGRNIYEIFDHNIAYEIRGHTSGRVFFPRDAFFGSNYDLDQVLCSKTIFASSLTRKRMFNIMKKTSLRGKKKGWDDGTERKRLYHTDGHAADHIGFIFFTVCPLQKSEESMDPRDPFFSAACGTDRSCGMCAVTGRRLYGFSYAGSAFMRNLRDHLSGADPDCAICLSKKTQ